MNRPNKPHVLVTGPAKTLRIGWWCTRFMLWMAGARASYLAPGNPWPEQSVDAVVIGGGDDIEPHHYGDSIRAESNYDPARDALEMSVLKSALQAGIPLMGICRGAQLINVVMGGSLYSDIRLLRVCTPNRNTAFPIKWAGIVEDTLLRSLCGGSRIRINSLHDQAIDRIAPGLCVSARDDDGFIQAIEASNDHWLLGVQWHPEYMPYAAQQRALFRALVMAANANNQASNLGPASHCDRGDFIQR